MKASVCYEFGKPLVQEEVDIDPPQKGQVKVRIAATAICHSDIHVIRGELVVECLLCLVMNLLAMLKNWEKTSPR